MPLDPDDATRDLNQDTIEASFALLELCMDRLAQIAPVDAPEQILELLPEVAAEATRLILVELIKYDLAKAAEWAPGRTLEFYWPCVAEKLPQDRIPFDLVLEEVQLRRAAGDKPSWEDYRQRFPDLAATIGKWLAGGESAGVVGATSRVPELPVGEQVDDFFILKQLGQGAFARVYLARQESMQRLVALKATSRGSEEPQALSQLDHANVVRVYDQRQINDPPTILLYMQYVAGGTVADCIKHVRSLPQASWCGQHVLQAIDRSLLGASQSVPEQSMIRAQIAEMTWPEVVAWVGIQLAEGLGYASVQGVLHRDVKPANILLSAEAIPKLADFNVSCSGLSGRAGAAAYFGGSLAYMSPEQLQVADPTDGKMAEQLDGRSDLYALGIVLWELWQGRRPWLLTDIASSWTEAVQMQRSLRSQDFKPQAEVRSATERVLEKVLRSMLSVQPQQRPASGVEAAARLKLAFYPELAQRFEPSPKSLAGWLLGLPVLLVALVLIFGPNTAASVFNYAYNYQRMQDVDPEYASPDALTAKNVGRGGDAESAEVEPESGRLLIPGIVEDFKWVANIVNAIVFPLGGILFLSVMWPIAAIVQRGRQGLQATPDEITRLFQAGNHATLVCGILWCVSGIVFACSFASMHREFDLDDAFHFFISLVLCGGVAWIYPYFGMTLLCVLVYYPKVVSTTMSDPLFDQRCRKMQRQMRWYLLSAAAIPLTALGLLVFSQQEHANYILVGVMITGLGLYASFYAFQKLDDTMQQLTKVLGNEDKGLVL